MKDITTSRARMAAAASTILAAICASPANAGDVSAEKEKAAREAGIQAVVYGLPIVMMDLTMKAATNVKKPVDASAPVNQFANLRAFPTAAFKEVVRANVDTLYSSAFLDLSQEPIVLSVPDTQGRYYLMPMMDAWTNVFASPGKRTTGTKAGHFAITGPGWSGALPDGVQQLKSPTNTVWILGRTQTNGPPDYPAVHSIQDGYGLVPLSSYGKPYDAPEGRIDPDADTKTPPVKQLQAMTTTAFLETLARLLKSNPPPASEAPILAKLATIGVKPGEVFDPSKLDPAVAKGLEGCVPIALSKVVDAAKQTGKSVNGWRVPAMTLGDYGTDYGERAAIALVAIGANLPADAVYPTTYVDAVGAPLDGANRYVLHFDAGRTPPVNAFWSLTAYDQQSFFVANAIDRYAISSWMALQRNDDGSLDINIQHDSPGPGKETNWLPVPEGPFDITLRMYWPKGETPSILDGSWKPPAVSKR